MSPQVNQKVTVSLCESVANYAAKPENDSSWSQEDHSGRKTTRFRYGKLRRPKQVVQPLTFEPFWFTSNRNNTPQFLT
jgi:hypothetical protein